jgi:hypothetical protein
MKRGKRGNRSIHRNHTDLRSNIPGQESLRVLWGVNSEEMPQEGITLSPQVMERFTQTMRDLGLVNTGRNRYSKDRVIITWENQGQNLHILIQGDNSHLTRQLLGFLSDSSFTLNQDDDLRVS